MKRYIISLILICTTLVAYAGPKNVLVLRAEGTADASSRTTVETHVLRLAKKIDGKVDAGDITLSEAAAAAGCNAADAACKDEILATFGVDELVTTTVTASGGKLTITVRRLTKGAAPRTAASTLASGQAPDPKLDQDLGPLFGLAATTAPVTPVTPVEAKQPPPPPPPVTPAEPAKPVVEDTSTAPLGTAGTAMTTTPTQPMQTDTAMPDRKWQKIGMGVGAGMVLLSLIMWTRASSLQDQIDSAPHDTPTDFKHLKDLESDADGMAGGGNLFFIGGVVLAGVSGYFYWKKGRAHRTQTARIIPTAFPHGAGLVLTFGGAQ